MKCLKTRKLYLNFNIIFFEYGMKIKGLLLLILYSLNVFGVKKNNIEAPVIKIGFANTFDSIMHIPYQTMNKLDFDFGYFATEKAIVKFNFNVTDHRKKYIQLKQPFIDQLQLVVYKKDSLVFKSENTGLDILKKQFKAPYFGFNNSYLFDLDMKKGEYTGYFLINSPYSPVRSKINCYNYNPRNLKIEYLTEKQSNWNLIFGFIGFACFVTVLLFLITKEKYYLFFAFYAICNIATIYINRGFAIPFYKFLDFYQYDVRVLLQTFWAISGFIYFYYLIPQQYTHRYVRKLLLFFFWYGIVVNTIFNLLPKSLTNWHCLIILLKPILFIGIGLIIAQLLIAIKKGYSLAKLFFLAYAVLFFTIFYHFFQVLGFIPSKIEHTFKVWEMSTILELLIFTFIFIYKYYQTNKEKIVLAENLVVEKNKSMFLHFEAQENERKKIAQNIHDGVLQQLVSVKHRVGSISSKKTEKINDDIDETINELRNLSHKLLPKSLLKFGLIDAIDFLLKDNLESHNIAYDYNYRNINYSFSEQIEVSLYRCLQELIKNTISHSKANKVYVELYKIEKNLICIYEDNGIGFDVNNIENKGIGLKNIEIRINSLKGEFSIENAINTGVIAIFKIPIITL